MKKKSDYDFLPCLSRWKKTLLIMKLTILLIFLSVFSVNASVYSQQTLISLKMENATVSELLKEIQKQTEFQFFFNDELVNSQERVNIDMANKTVEDILDEAFSNTNITYQIVDKTIFISEAEKNEMKIAEAIEIKGKVTDVNGNPLPGTTILEKGTLNGVTTDANGNYTLTVSGTKSVIIISYLGFASQEVIIGNQTIINIVLKESSESLKEVVITGYQIKDKRETSSSVVTINTEKLPSIGSSSIETMLQGHAEGLSVINTSAAPGAAPRVRVRGTATISGNAEPVWVIDGVMLENSVPVTPAELNDPEFMESFNSAIGGISANDIETITILKDASATAIYGTRAANGVIVVTTKRGKKGKPRVNFNHTSKLSMRPSYGDFNLMNSKERAQLTLESIEDNYNYIYGEVGVAYYQDQYYANGMSLEDYQAGIRKVQTMNTDWFKLLFHDAYSITNDLNISGGNEKSDYYFSLSQSSQDGLDRISNYKSYSGMAKINTEIFKGFNMRFTLHGSRRDRKQYMAHINPFHYAYKSSRSLYPYNDDGTLFFYGTYGFNIFNEQQTTDKKSSQSDLKAMVDLSYELTKGITIRSLWSYNASNTTTQEYATERSKYVAEIRKYRYGAGTADQIAESPLPYGGIYNQTDFAQKTYLIRNSISSKFSPIEDMSMDIMAGQEFRTVNYDGLATRNYGYMHDRGKIFYSPELSEEAGHIYRNTATRTTYNRSYVSYFGIFSAMYKNKYVINANIRFDGSNLFGSNPDYRYLPLWSVAAKWHMERESFLESVEFITALSLRASYGLRGNIVEEATPQIIAAALPPNKFTGMNEMRIVQAPNPELKWETTKSINIGLDFSLFDRRLSGAIDFYQDLGSDLIAHKEVSAVTGFMTKAVNYANVTNLGVDIGLNAKIFDKNDFSWSTSVTASFLKSEVTKSYIDPQISNLLKSTYTIGQVVEGKTINSMYSYRFARLNNEGIPLFYDKDGNEMKGDDENFAVKVLDNIDALKYEGSREPNTTIGFGNTFKYRHLSLSFMFVAGLDFVIRLPKAAFNNVPAGELNASRDVMNRWRKPGDEAIYTIPIMNGDTYFSSEIGPSYGTQMYNLSNMQVISGDYLRLRNVLLQYKLPKSITDKWGIEGATIKFQAENLFVIANKRLNGMDPETANYSSSSYGSLPLPKTFTLGLNFNF